MCFSCRNLITALTATCIGVAAAACHAQPLAKYPAKPIRLVVAFGVGSPSDALARTIVPKLSETWDQPVVVDNRPGDNGVVGAAIVAKAIADGHTLLITSASFVVSAVMHAKMPYDSRKDFTGVMELAPSAGVLVVSPSLGVRSLKEFIAFANAQPKGISFGSGGVGMGTYINAERFRFAAGISAAHIPFPDTQQSVVATAAGQVHYCFTAVRNALPSIKEGKLLALGVNTAHPMLRDVPPIVDTLPGFEDAGSYMLLVPAATPAPVVQQLANEFTRIVRLADVKQKLLAEGLVAAASPSREYNQLLRSQIDSLAKFVRVANIKVE
jgi:tripartite-type tricarboxylate transporter receptor subunit TctC